jgi:pimeloyl-ACP methyl ester carboxylesterase
MFQGGGTNPKHWGEYTKSKFLTRLKKLGAVYTYQDKLYNIWHYNLDEKTHADYPADINFDIDYINPETHIKAVYADLTAKYPNAKFIPVGWSAGGLFALLFAQKYAAKCVLTVLLDSVLISKNNMLKRLTHIKKKIHTDTKITHKLLNQMLLHWKTKRNPIDMFTIADLCQYYRSLYFFDHLNEKLSTKTVAFVNINDPELADKSNYFNNKNKKIEMANLSKANPTTYTAIVMKNATHYVFNKVSGAKLIIKEIENRM